MLSGEESDGVTPTGVDFEKFLSPYRNPATAPFGGVKSSWISGTLIALIKHGPSSSSRLLEASNALFAAFFLFLESVASNLPQGSGSCSLNGYWRTSMKKRHVGQPCKGGCPKRGDGWVMHYSAIIEVIERFAVWTVDIPSARIER
jgi:hypothetical protein